MCGGEARQRGPAEVVGKVGGKTSMAEEVAKGEEGGDRRGQREGVEGGGRDRRRQRWLGGGWEASRLGG
jgi:hypothetical protein